MAWFSKKPRIVTTPEPVEAPSRMRGLWAKCESCDEIIYRQELEKNLNVCPHCEHHLPWTARARLASLLDSDSFEEFDKELEPQDPLTFSDTKKYKDRLRSTRKALG
jgi:acetyl-CoA carboxylase carboxyl transferase subunit beta